MKGWLVRVLRRAGMAGLLAAGLAACGGGPRAPESPGAAAYGIEIVVRTPANFRTPADVGRFVEQAARHGVGTISLLVKQDEDGTIPSGAVYYRSTVAPVAQGYAGFDVLQTMLEAAHARGLRVQAWIPQFHDQVAARANPAWQMRTLKNGAIVPYTGARQTEYFVNPLDPAVQAYQLAIVREVVTRYAVDGVMLDWIRFDDYPMDLGDVTRAQYQARHGVDPATIDFTRAGPERDRWNAFRTDGIAAQVAAVRTAVGPAMPLGVYILPPEFVEVGQDAAKFRTSADVLAPMCYHRDWGYPLPWLWDSCLHDTVARAGPAAVVPTLDSGLTDADYQALFAQLRTRFPQVRTLAWFFHDTWTEERLARIARLSRP